MKTTKLQFDYDYDFLLIGILSGVPDYRFCWILNKLLGLNLKKQEDLVIQINIEEKNKSPKLDFEKPEKKKSFSFYACENETLHVSYKVVANRTENHLLIKEEQSVDFFLIIDGLYDDLHASEIIRKVRESDMVITAYEIDPNQLKSKENLIFE